MVQFIRGVRMDQFISLIIFSLPGLVTYFWLQMFGLNPVVKHTPTEMVGLTALLWAPTTFLTILLYDFFFLLFNILFRFLHLDLSFLNLKFVLNLKDLNNLSNNILFLFYYLILSIVFSFLAAYIWSRYLYQKVLNLINKVRLQRKIIKLSEDPTVWESFFYKLEEQKEEQLIIEIYKIDKPEDKICGPVIRMSRPFEIDKSLIIDYSKGWDKAHEYYKYAIKRSYVDTKSGLVINELDPKSPASKIIT
jgi:hypothetical protein